MIDPSSKVWRSAPAVELVMLSPADSSATVGVTPGAISADAAATSFALWPAAVNAVRLGIVTYIIPFMFLSYPGMLWSGSWLEIAEAALSGATLVLAASLFLAGTRIRDSRWLAGALYLSAAGLAIVPSEIALGVAVALTILGVAWGRPFSRSRESSHSGSTAVPSASSEFR